MEYEFSVGAFFVGLLIIAAGVAFVRWHQKIADNFGNGVASYDKYKIAAFITCGVGFLVALNLHATIVLLIIRTVFPNA